MPWTTAQQHQAEKEQSWGKSLRLQLALPVAQFHKHCNYLLSSKGIFFFFSKKILLEMTFFPVTEDHLHSILYLPLSRCGWKIIYSAQRHSWVPAPASPLAGLMRRHQRRGFDSSGASLQSVSGHACGQQHRNEKTPVSAQGSLSGELAILGRHRRVPGVFRAFRGLS